MIFIGIIGFLIGQSDGSTWRNGNALTIDQISREAQKRYELIRSGCNLLRLEKTKYCKTKRSRQILVIGNSHETDGYNIFSQVYRGNKNVNLISFGSLNPCQISLENGIPTSEVKHRKCDTRAAILADKNFIATLDGVIFSSNQPFDEKRKAAWEILQYIKNISPDIPIVVLGGYINTTHRCSDLYHRFGSFSACKNPVHVSYNPFNEQELSKLDKSKAVKYLYIDKTRLLCKNETLESCRISLNDEPAFYDWHHLTMSFSRYLGKRIANEYNKELRQWGFPSVVPPKAAKKSKKEQPSQWNNQ